ncbi:MAG: hypothetical protein WDZ40_03190 [Candidatus Spechtbacterales bacterium]
MVEVKALLDGLLQRVGVLLRIRQPTEAEVVVEGVFQVLMIGQGALAAVEAVYTGMGPIRGLVVVGLVEPLAIMGQQGVPIVVEAAAV